MIGRVTEALSKVKGSIGSNERHALHWRDRGRPSAVWETATLPVHLHHYYGDYRGHHCASHAPVDRAA